MRTKCKGKSTVFFADPPRIISGGTIVGDVEAQGPLGSYFDIALEDDTWGEDTWEKAERKMFEHAVRTAVEKGGLTPMQVDILLGGDLLNQIISANFAARELEIPFLGLYGACSTMAEGMLIGSMLIDGGFADRVACAASSHFSTAERQYRLPLEMGSQAVPTSQRTVTGAGCALLSGSGCADKGSLSNVCIAGGVIGRVVDLGITDAANMGAAMAPAAYETLRAHFADTGRTPADYAAIITGDLGKIGHEILTDLFLRDGVDLGVCSTDCGMLIFNPETQDVHAGGSGCGCSASVLCGHILQRMTCGDWPRVLFAATGALMSPTTSQQGESIPGICHAVVLDVDKG